MGRGIARNFYLLEAKLCIYMLAIIFKYIAYKIIKFNKL